MSAQSSNSQFKATAVLHLMYDNDESAALLGHKRNGYATAICKEPNWFQNKDTFMAFVCKAFEQFYDEMKNERPAS